jgi:hypothetical protein
MLHLLTAARGSRLWLRRLISVKYNDGHRGDATRTEGSAEELEARRIRAFALFKKILTNTRGQTPSNLKHECPGDSQDRKVAASVDQRRRIVMRCASTASKSAGTRPIRPTCRLLGREYERNCARVNSSSKQSIATRVDDALDPARAPWRKDLPSGCSASGWYRLLTISSPAGRQTAKADDRNYKPNTPPQAWAPIVPRRARIRVRCAV